jgi:hypothetical protein
MAYNSDLARYHYKCLKIARGKVKEDDKYTCPICDWRMKIPRDASRPKLEELLSLAEEMTTLPFQPEEEEILSKIIENAQNFRNHIARYCNPLLSTEAEAETQRFYLRKIEGAEVLLTHETNFFRQELHKWCPVAPEAPPIQEQSRSTRKPRPTKASITLTIFPNTQREKRTVYAVKQPMQKRQRQQHRILTRVVSQQAWQLGMEDRHITLEWAKAALPVMRIRIAGSLSPQAIPEPTQ